MKKVKKEKDELGQWVIYVEECEKFVYEHPDTPKTKLCELDFENWEEDGIM